MKKDMGEQNLVQDITASGILSEIKKIIDPMVQKADRLVYNQTTNQAERYINIKIILYYIS